MSVAPHIVVAKANALAGLLDPKAVLLACSEVLAQEIPVFAVGKSPAGGTCFHGGLPRIETAVLVAVAVLVVVAIAAARLVCEVFGKPVVVSDFDNFISVPVARVLEFFCRSFFRRGGSGNADS